MKKIFIHAIFLFTGLLIGSCNNYDKPISTGPGGPYLGQELPGDIPQLFAPGIVGDIFREHSSAAFTPDGNEVFWTRQVRGVTPDTAQYSRVVVTMHMKRQNGHWTRPALASFSENWWTFITCITGDGRRIYFAGIRRSGENGKNEVGAWVTEKTADGWGSPKKFTALDKWGMKLSKVHETASGNIYFTSSLPKKGLRYERWGVGFYRSRLVNGGYQRPDTLSRNINSDYLDYGFHIDPLEKYIIFSSARPGGYSSLDLYISYHLADDTWSEPINLGEKINTAGVDGSDWPYLSPDGKYLFFMTAMRPLKNIDPDNYTYRELLKSQLSITNEKSKIHWVSAGFIEKLRPQGVKLWGAAY